MEFLLKNSWLNQLNPCIALWEPMAEGSASGGMDGPKGGVTGGDAAGVAARVGESWVSTCDM